MVGFFCGLAFENATCGRVVSAGEGGGMVDVFEDGVDFLDLNPDLGFLLDLGAGVGSNLNLLLGDLSRAPKVFLPNLSLSLRLNLLLSVFTFDATELSELDSDFSKLDLDCFESDFVIFGASFRMSFFAVVVACQV